MPTATPEQMRQWMKIRSDQWMKIRSERPNEFDLDRMEKAVDIAAKDEETWREDAKERVETEMKTTATVKTSYLCPYCRADMECPHCPEKIETGMGGLVIAPLVAEPRSMYRGCVYKVGGDGESFKIEVHAYTSEDGFVVEEAKMTRET